MWAARLPLKKIGKTIGSFHKITLSAACINSALCNVSDAVEPLVNQIRHEICASHTVHFDESSYPINGDTGWVWVATTGQGCLVMIQRSRGACVLLKYFGTFHGVAVADGWYAYRIFEILQRCWAHILREAKHLADRIRSHNAAHLYWDL